MSKVAFVYGSAGALGKAVVASLKSASFQVFGVDLFKNDECEHSYVLSGKDLESDLNMVVKDLSDRGTSRLVILAHVERSILIGSHPFPIDLYSHLAPGLSFDVVICAAGGWAGGSFSSETSSLIESVNKMWSMNVQTAVAAGHIGSKFVKKGGLVVFMGANAGRSGTPSMVGYGISKAATHQLSQSLSQELKDQGTTVISILPIIIDTPANRTAMPNADFSTWTPTKEIADKIVSYVDSSRPETGSMLLVATKDNVTSWEVVHTLY